jgi:hypothetical protein
MYYRLNTDDLGRSLLLQLSINESLKFESHKGTKKMLDIITYLKATLSTARGRGPKCRTSPGMKM